jgi:hypothetical protein
LLCRSDRPDPSSLDQGFPEFAECLKVALGLDGPTVRQAAPRDRATIRCTEGRL